MAGQHGGEMATGTRFEHAVGIHDEHQVRSRFTDTLVHSPAEADVRRIPEHANGVER
jgi:hypothetical protein